MTAEERSRIAQLEAWRGAWLACAAWVRVRAEERAVAWVERRIPARFEDRTYMPCSLPERLQVRFRRQEERCGDRLERAARHEAKAEACAAAIRRIREEARERQSAARATAPVQTALL